MGERYMMLTIIMHQRRQRRCYVARFFCKLHTCAAVLRLLCVCDMEIMNNNTAKNLLHE